MKHKRMKLLSITIFITLLQNTFFLSAQEFAWPIQGQPAGTDILLYPTDLIYNKYRDVYHEYWNYLLTAKEGTAIVSPCDGIIDWVVFSISPDYLTGYSDDNLEKLRNLAKERLNIDEKYVHYHISIRTADGEMVRLSGLAAPPSRVWQEGERVKKGEFLGNMGWCYPEFEEPTLEIHLGRGGKNADIGPKLLGIDNNLKFTSREDQDKNYANHKHSVQELQEAFHIFCESLKESHPGLYDYVTPEELDRLLSETETELEEVKTSDEFYALLMPIIRGIGDNHTYLVRKYLNSENYTYSPRGYLPVNLGIFEGKCYVLEDYGHKDLKKGNELVNIQGMEIAEMQRKVEQLQGVADGLIPTRTETLFQLKSSFLGFSLNESIVLYFNLKPGASLVVQSLDKQNETQEHVLQIVGENPRKNNPPFSYMEFDYTPEETGVLKINIMNLKPEHLRQVEEFLQECIQKEIGHLVVDLRRNMGGDMKVTAKLYSYFASGPFRSEVERSIRKKGMNDCLSHSENMFGIPFWGDDYSEIDGRYVMSIDEPIEPDNNVHYEGKLYILTSGMTGSAAVAFAAMVKQQDRGLVIGQEGSNGYYRMNAIDFAKISLGSTGIVFNLPLIQTVFTKEQHPDIPFGRGVVPDVQVIRTIDAFLQDIDLELSAVEDLIDLDKSRSQRVILFSLVIGVIGMMVISSLILRKKKKIYQVVHNDEKTGC